MAQLPGDRVPREEGLAVLVGDILRDGQKLVQQELLLFRTELQQEWTKAKSAALVFAMGAVVAGAAALALSLFLVHVLAAVTGLPLWACYGIFAVALGGGSVFLFLRGRKLAQDVDFVPRQTVDTVKENVRWFKNRI